MFQHCRRIVPAAPWRRILLHSRPVSVTRNFWNFPRPNDFRSLVRDMERIERQFIDHFPFRRIAPRFIPIQGVEQRGNSYRVNVDVDGFKPEEINISLKDNVLKIRAKMERKSEDGSKYQQEFVRELTLPDNVDPAELKSFLSNDGILSIEAAYKPEEKPKEIPVSREK